MTTSRRTGISFSPVSSSTTSSCTLLSLSFSHLQHRSSSRHRKQSLHRGRQRLPRRSLHSHQRPHRRQRQRSSFSPFLIAQGCPSGRGLSPGHASKSPHGCAGGGGYGGLGGSGGHDETGGDGGGTYGNRSFPLLMGSGGGSMSQSGGTGGGVIVIYSTVTRILYEGGVEWRKNGT